MGNDRDLLRDVLGMSQPEEKKVEEPEKKVEQPEKKAEEDVKAETATNEPEGENEIEVDEDTLTGEPEEEQTATGEPEKETEDGKEEKEEVLKPDDDLISLAKEIDPDGEYADNQSAIEAIKADLKEKAEFIDNYKKFNNDLIEMFDSNPDVAQFAKAVIEGMDPKVAAGIYISETLAPEEGDESIKTYKEELSKRKKETENRKIAQQEFNDNIKKSRQVVQEFIQEQNVDAKEMESILKEVDDELVNQNKGVVSKKFLELVLKGKKYDAQIKKAEELAYLRGKNEKIKLVRSKKTEGDGMPKIATGLGAEKQKKDFGLFGRVFEKR